MHCLHGHVSCAYSVSFSGGVFPFPVGSLVIVGPAEIMCGVIVVLSSSARCCLRRLWFSIPPPSTSRVCMLYLCFSSFSACFRSIWPGFAGIVCMCTWFGVSSCCHCFGGSTAVMIISGGPGSVIILAVGFMRSLPSITTR